MIPNLIKSQHPDFEANKAQVNTQLDPQSNPDSECTPQINTQTSKPKPQVNTLIRSQSPN
jgi:energy-converting hydrogenase Eha subunit F